jgi:hypothetical protein
MAACFAKSELSLDLPTENGLAGNLPSLPVGPGLLDRIPSSPAHVNHLARLMDQESSLRFRINPQCM